MQHDIYVLRPLDSRGRTLSVSGNQQELVLSGAVAADFLRGTEKGLKRNRAVDTETLRAVRPAYWLVRPRNGGIGEVWDARSRKRVAILAHNDTPEQWVRNGRRKTTRTGSMLAEIDLDLSIPHGKQRKPHRPFWGNGANPTNVPISGRR
jgi:hypothetical protein